MRKRPGQSLGIATVNQMQRELLRDEMDRLFRTESDAERYREDWETRDDGLYPFFVKNLENVQGDERDVIVVSSVYGPTSDGRKPQNFGPINKRYGHRRLNVLFTRARDQLVLFTSMTPEFIQLRETTGLGPRILKQYIEYAKTGRLGGDGPEGGEFESDFEIAVATRLEGLGYRVVPQWGVAGYRIDLAVEHPDFPGTFLVGVECDGATYHSGKSARDRDRLRQEVLEGQGWNIYRIWSTDWFDDPERETEKFRTHIEFLAEQRRTQFAAQSFDIGSGEPDEPEVQVDEIVAEPVTADGSAETAQIGQVPEIVLGDEPAVEEGPDEPADKDVTRVEIGDEVTFFYRDKPRKKHIYTIVSDMNEPKDGIVSHLSPVGDAFLYAKKGEEVDVYQGDEVRTAIITQIDKRVSPNSNSDHDESSDGRSTDMVDEIDGEVREAEDLDNSETVVSAAGADAVRYAAWEPREMPDPRDSGTTVLGSYLLEIIEIEGPIRVPRLYRLYSRAAGISRVARIVRVSLNKALYGLTKNGKIQIEYEGIDTTNDSGVVRLTGSPKINLRTPGNRNFWDVPPSEIAAVLSGLKELGKGDDIEALHRSLIEIYGVGRLTTNIRRELERVEQAY